MQHHEPDTRHSHSTSSRGISGSAIGIGCALLGLCGFGCVALLGAFMFMGVSVEETAPSMHTGSAYSTSMPAALPSAPVSARSEGVIAPRSSALQLPCSGVESEDIAAFKSIAVKVYRDYLTQETLSTEVLVDLADRRQVRIAAFPQRVAGLGLELSAALELEFGAEKGARYLSPSVRHAVLPYGVERADISLTLVGARVQIEDVVGGQLRLSHDTDNLPTCYLRFAPYGY